MAPLPRLLLGAVLLLSTVLGGLDSAEDGGGTCAGPTKSADKEEVELMRETIQRLTEKIEMLQEKQVRPCRRVDKLRILYRL